MTNYLDCFLYSIIGDTYEESNLNNFFVWVSMYCYF